MSDLISRSKLIDYFYFGIDDKPIIDGISDRKIIDIIKNQPTAYSVDKVVEELEQHYDDDSVICGLTYNDAIKKAIEIVKHGCVDDDMCEWEYVDAYSYYKVGCKENIVPIQYGDYCPYCGKKIKVVE